MVRPGIRDVPNILSALRLLAAPVAAWLIVASHDIAALAVFLVSDDNSFMTGGKVVIDGGL